LKIDIEASGHKDGHDCLEDILAVLSHWLGRDYEMMFMDTWGFIYYPPMQSKILGSRIDTGDFRVWENLHYYHGILANWRFNLTMEERFCTIRSELSKNCPVIMHTDGYYIPWIKIYQKFHRDHTCLIIGIDEDDNLICLDPFWNTDINLLPKENFVLSDSTCTTICLEDEKVKQVWANDLEKAIKNLIGKNNRSCFDMLRSFSDDLYNLINLSDEIKGCEEWPYVAPLFMQLFKIGHSRTNFGSMLNYLGDRYDQSYLNIYAEKLKLLKDKWISVIRTLVLVSEAIDYKAELNYCYDTLYEIADEEESIANDLYNKLKGLSS
jgi:hypothetical protein